MKISTKEYEKDRETIYKYYDEKGLKRCIEVSVASTFPLVVVYTFLNERYGGFEDKIQDLVEFYGYTEII